MQRGPRGTNQVLAIRTWRYCFPGHYPVGIPEEMISRLDTSPIRTPVNASPTPLRASTHDSGPSWVATPSMCGSFTRFSTPVYPGARWVPALPKRQRYFLQVSRLRRKITISARATGSGKKNG